MLPQLQSLNILAKSYTFHHFPRIPCRQRVHIPPKQVMWNTGTLSVLKSVLLAPTKTFPVIQHTRKGETSIVHDNQMKPPLTLFFFLLSGLYVSLTSTSLFQDHLNLLRLQIANPLGTLGRNSALVGGSCTPLFTGFIPPFTGSVDGLDNHQKSHRDGPQKLGFHPNPSKIMII